MAKTLRIGGASGYWGDASQATAQLLRAAPDVIVYDYLAEITLGIMARMRARDPEAGFATDFVSAAMAPNLARIADGGVKILSNAGGMNPRACAEALRAEIDGAVAAGMPLADTVFVGGGTPTLLPGERLAEFGYHLVFREDRKDKEAVRQFVEWVRSEAAAGN